MSSFRSLTNRTNNIMGYDTSFSSYFELDKPLTSAHRDYLAAFSNTRRMARDINHEELLDDAIRLAAELPLGDQGGYYVGGAGFLGQDNAKSVIEYNSAPTGQPNLWCRWAPGSSGETIEWDWGGSFYNYVEWLEYIIEHFLRPWGYVLSGDVHWEGDDGASDTGCISVNDNVVTVRRAQIIYDDDDYDEVKVERDAYREALSAVMPSDFKAWWQNSKAEGPQAAALIIKEARERLECDATDDAARLAMLETLWAGSAKVGRWLAAGEEVEPDDEGAEWAPHTPEEQAEWLRDSVVPILEQLLFKHDADGNPIISLEILRKHAFDKERHDQTRYPQAHAD